MTHIHDHGHNDGLDFDLTGFEALAAGIRKHTRSGGGMQSTVSDLAAAHTAANEGIAQSFHHAADVDDSWPDAALGFLYRYARTHAEFTIEEMTAEADRLGYGSPADSRAWGSIVRRAAIRGFILNTHTMRPRVKGHGAPGPVWRSLVYVGSAA